MRNSELFALYEGELAFRHRSQRGLNEAKRILNHFHNFLGEYPPSQELAKSFLSQFSERKPTTLARYAAVLKVFLNWYGEKLDLKIKVPKTLPAYVEQQQVDKLLEAIDTKKTHKASIQRDKLLIDLAIHTGLRRCELANLSIRDIDLNRQVVIVRQGKGSKDRAIPLSDKMSKKLADFLIGKSKEDSLFGLAPATISGKIKTFAKKAGVDIHAHSLRDYFATSLSEKGATIREIQSLLGHSNLTHTERYTLHTDKHLRKAIELLDSPDNKMEAIQTSEPIVTIRSVGKLVDIDQAQIMTGEYHSHFMIANEGQSPAIELEIALLDSHKNWLEGYRQTVLSQRESLEFRPTLNRDEGNYYIVCQFRLVSDKDSSEFWNQTWLPFKLSRATKEGEVYVIAGELEFKPAIPTQHKIRLFINKPK